MYTLLIWHVLNTPDEKQFNNALLNLLEGRSWYRPFRGFYIVKIGGVDDWQELFNDITGLAKGFSNQIYFFMSQPLEGRVYNGYLPTEAWDEINERTRGADL